MINGFLHSREFLDARLLFENLGLFEVLGLVLVGILAGLITANQIWFVSRRRIKQLELEQAILEGEQILIEEPPVEAEVVTPVVSNKSIAPAAARPKFIVAPESTTSDSERLFTVEGDSKSDRVVFIMDVSMSLKDPQLALCKSELTRALKKLPPSTDYQVIFFSGATWFANQRMVAGGRQGERVVIRDAEDEMIWKAGFGDFRYQNGNHNLPAGQWRKATSENIDETLGDIREVTQSFGTTWHLPFMLAMNLDPVPDEIYFLTDGEVAHQDLVAEGIVEMVKNKGADTRINTRSLMVPNAASPLRHIANETSGEYLLIDLAKV